ncbi:MAG: hypothetical protein AABX10_03615 [Nanoarchaeota archaeon]
MSIEIYLANVASTANLAAIGNFAYHLVRDGKSSIADLDYGVADKSLLVEILKKHSSSEGVTIRNGIPDGLSRGYTLDYKFADLNEDDFSSIISESGLKIKSSAT